MSSPVPPLPHLPRARSPVEMTDLLRQLLEVQREQLTHMQATAATHDTSARWRAGGRRRQDFPNCPTPARSAAHSGTRLWRRPRRPDRGAAPDGSEAFESEFTLQDFLDRYGIVWANSATSSIWSRRWPRWPHRPKQREVLADSTIYRFAGEPGRHGHGRLGLSWRQTVVREGRQCVCRSGNWSAGRSSTWGWPYCSAPSWPLHSSGSCFTLPMKKPGLLPGRPQPRCPLLYTRPSRGV